MMIRDRAIVTFCLVMNEVVGMEPIGCWEWNQLGAGNGTNWVLGMESIGC